MAGLQRERMAALLHDRKLARQSPEAAAAEMARRRAHLVFYTAEDPAWPDDTDDDAERIFNARCAEIAKQGLDITDETLGCTPILLPPINSDLSDADRTYLMVIVSRASHRHQVQAIVARALSRAGAAQSAEVEDVPSQDPLTDWVREMGTPPGAARTTRRHQVSLACRSCINKEAGHDGPGLHHAPHRCAITG